MPAGVLAGLAPQVRVQADARFRAQPEDIQRLEVRNATGQMIPLGTLLRVEERLGPQTITRYDLHPTASITGPTNVPGSSAGPYGSQSTLRRESTDLAVGLS